MANKWAYAVFLVLGLAILAFIIAGFMGIILGLSSPERMGTGNVMLLSLSGPITTQPSQGIFGTEPPMSSFIIDNLKRADEDPSIDAVVLSIDSPGGGAVASYEVVEALKDVDKPTVAIIRSVGASGAYWVASAADRIYANPFSMVGSIGVTSSYLEVSGLLERYNITYERLVSGDFKDAGSPVRKLTDEEREVLQTQIDRVHEIFMDDVIENRGLSGSDLEVISDGRVFLGAESVDYGLVDELGNMNDVEEYLEDLLNVSIRFRETKRRTSAFPFFSSVSSDFAFNVGRGFASWIVEDEKPEEMISLR